MGGLPIEEDKPREVSAVTSSSSERTAAHRETVTRSLTGPASPIERASDSQKKVWRVSSVQYGRSNPQSPSVLKDKKLKRASVNLPSPTKHDFRTPFEDPVQQHLQACIATAERTNEQRSRAASSVEFSGERNLSKARAELFTIPKPQTAPPLEPLGNPKLEVQEEILKAQMSELQENREATPAQKLLLAQIEKDLSQITNLRKTHSGIVTKRNGSFKRDGTRLSSSNRGSMVSSDSDSSSYESDGMKVTMNPLMMGKMSKNNILKEELLLDFDEKETDDNVLFEEDDSNDDVSVESSLSDLSEISRGSARSGRSDMNLEVKILQGSGMLTGGGFLDGIRKKDKDSPQMFSPSTMKPSDTYVSIRLLRAQNMDQAAATYKTKTIKKNMSPVWNETFWFRHDITKTEQLHIQVFNHNRIGSADQIGEAYIPLTHLQPNQPQNKDYDVNEGIAKVKICVTYLPPKVLNVTGINTTLKAASLNKLIEKMTPIDRKEKDNDFIDDILTGYRALCSASHLLDLLIARYRGPPIGDRDPVMYEKTLKALQPSVSAVIDRWLEDPAFIYDFSDDVQFSDKMYEFLKSIEKPDGAMARALARLTAIRITPGHGTEQFRMSELPMPSSLQHHLTNSPIKAENDPKSPPKPSLVRSGSILNVKQSQAIDFSAEKNLQLAQQLTLIEYSMMKTMRNTEFLKQAWSKSEKETKAKHIVKFAQWFNKVSSIVATDILKCVSPEERSVVMGKWINIGVRLAELNNYNAVMEIVSALHSAAVSRLSQSWGMLPMDLMEQFTMLTQLMSPADNFKNYREKVRATRTTCIPYLALALQDLTFMDDANNDYMDGSTTLINYDKIKMVSRRIKDFKDGLRAPYQFLPHETTQSLWLNAEPWTENDIFRMSKQREKKQESGDTRVPSRFDSKSFEKISKSILNGKALVSTTYKLTKRDWNLVIACSTTTSYKRNQIVMEEGSPNNSFYRVKKGRLRVEKCFKNSNSDGGLNIESKTVANLGLRDNFGEMSCIEAYGVASASVIADGDDVELYNIDMEFMEKLFSAEPGLAMRFYGRVANQLAEKLVSLTSRPKEAKAPGGSPKGRPRVKSIVAVDSSDDDNLAPKGLDPMQELLEKKFKKGETIIRSAKAVFKKKIAFHGDFIVTGSNICFYSKSFGYTVKEEIPMNTILNVNVNTKDDKELILFKATVKKKFSFLDKGEAKEMMELINPMRNKDFRQSKIEFISRERDRADTSVSNISTGSQDKAGTSPYIMSPTAERVDNKISNKVFQVLRPEDWDMILKGGAKSINVPKDGTIVHIGEQYQKIFQISRGSCRIEIEKDGEKIVLGHMHEGETFGEISFLQGKGASASVVSDSPEGVDLTIIEGYFINALFNIHADFAGRFFKYLATLISNRIKDRQSS